MLNNFSPAQCSFLDGSVHLLFGVVEVSGYILDFACRLVACAESWKHTLMCISYSVQHHSWQSCHCFKEPISVVTSWAWQSTPLKPSNKHRDGCVTHRGVGLERREMDNKKERAWWYKQALHNWPVLMPGAEVAAHREWREKFKCSIIRKEALLCHHVKSVEQESESCGTLNVLCWTWLTAAGSAELPGA